MVTKSRFHRCVPGICLDAYGDGWIDFTDWSENSHRADKDLSAGKDGGGDIIFPGKYIVSETIVMIHGMWGGEWCWENFKGFFEGKGYRCITPTLRFHDVEPISPPHPRLGTTSLLDYATDLENEINKLETLPILMGHSMGGLLAQIIGARGLAKALILLAPAAPYGIIALNPSVIRSFWSGLTRWSFWEKPMRQTFNEAVYAMLQLMTPEEQKKIYSKFVYESGRAASEIGFWFLDSKGAARVDEARVTCPVLVIGDAQDRITPVSVVRKVADKYRTVSTYMEFANHAHWVIEEPGWPEIAECISDWLSQQVKR
ncbi:alpha/beta hydrolase [Chloroflexota bacterium]